MADALAAMLSFPPDNVDKLSPKDYDRAMHAHMKIMDKTTQWTKPVDKQNILDLLNPTLNSIPYLYALIEHIKAAGKDKTRLDALLDRALIFFALFDPVQVRYVGASWVMVLGWVMDRLRAPAIPNLTPISTAILRLDPTAGTFTTNHLYFLRACLSSAVPSQALPILDKNIYAFPTIPPKNVPEDLLSEEHELSNAFITTKNGFTDKVQPDLILEYYLLGAHVYIGQRNWTRARLFLESVILTPSQQHATSALQVEAYKKWVLVGLLAEGKSYPLPRTHDTVVMKSIRLVAKPYDVLAEAFEKREWRKYQAEMDVGAQVWHDDGNLRMVKEAGDALLKYRVIDLQKTFAALPVSRVASHMGFTADATLHMVTDMIRYGALNASITPGSTSGEAVLRFHSTDVGPSSTVAQEGELAAQTKRIEDLVTFVRDADRRLQLTKEYVEHLKRVKRQGTGPDGDLADQMDLTWDAPVPGQDDGDEDIMAA
ncbi:hypothetical protein LTR36_010826 [Oleoguttula mirabilis]|uniref:COP9 signalosome complex subunit 3 N-terminal helical repeats domain-containing protein n=1 Tax=Oleoguttula mirabilis TaxID=1507867 RepID=A0AAV9J3T4_9PEZI|nr:hypothetical protein LTR36_010826 [Oleoguttula mirabilis]